MSGYDEVLEARHQRQLEEDERYAQWCEANGLDPDDDNVAESFQQWMQDMEDDYAAEMAESMREDAYFDYMPGECF